MIFKEGDYVKIVEREQTPLDVKNGTFYPYFCGLAGVVEHIYEEAISLNVDCDTLPSGVLKRHREIQESVKKKWLDGLSGEARNRLTPEEKKFELAYNILVQKDDLEPATQGEVKPYVAKSIQPSIKTEVESTPVANEISPDPISAGDLTAAEAAFLREREQAIKKDS